MYSLDALAEVGADASCEGSVPNGITELAKFNFGVCGMTVDATHVYWTQSPGVWSRRLDGCDTGPTLLVKSGDGESGACDIAVDATHIYWVLGGTGAGAIMRCAIGSCASTTMPLASINNFGSLAIDASRLFWTNLDRVMTCTKASCTPAPFVVNQVSVYSIATDGTDVFWADQTGIHTCSAGGCSGTPTTLVAGAVFRNLVAGPSDLYAVQNDKDLIRCAKTGCNQAPTTIASGTIRGVATDGASVFFTDSVSGNVSKCPSNGCGQPTILTVDPGARPIAVDGSSVYWGTYAHLARLTPK